LSRDLIMHALATAVSSVRRHTGPAVGQPVSLDLVSAVRVCTGWGGQQCLCDVGQRIDGGGAHCSCVSVSRQSLDRDSAPRPMGSALADCTCVWLNGLL
jgi:hypothetical protein